MRRFSKKATVGFLHLIFLAYGGLRGSLLVPALEKQNRFYDFVVGVALLASVRRSMSHNFFRGVSIEQSGRMGGDAKLKKKLKVAAVCDVKVSMAKVKLIIISKWVSQRITELLGFEDEVVINFIVNFLEAAEVPDAKQLQLDLTGFLEKQAGLFVEELWTLLVDAQKNEHGIPSVFLEKKKQELASAKKVNFFALLSHFVTCIDQDQ